MPKTKHTIASVTKELEAIWLDPRTTPNERAQVGKAIAVGAGPRRLFELVLEDPASSDADKKRAKAVLDSADKGDAKKDGKGIPPEDLKKARQDMSAAEKRQLNALQARLSGTGKPEVVSYEDAMGNHCVTTRN